VTQSAAGTNPAAGSKNDWALVVDTQAGSNVGAERDFDPQSQLPDKSEYSGGGENGPVLMYETPPAKPISADGK
jgi:hypothetical protein